MWSRTFSMTLRPLHSSCCAVGYLGVQYRTSDPPWWSSSVESLLQTDIQVTSQKIPLPQNSTKVCKVSAYGLTEVGIVYCAINSLERLFDSCATLVGFSLRWHAFCTLYRNLLQSEVSEKNMNGTEHANILLFRFFDVIGRSHLILLYRSLQFRENCRTMCIVKDFQKKIVGGRRGTTTHDESKLTDMAPRLQFTPWLMQFK